MYGNSFNKALFELLIVIYRVHKYFNIYWMSEWLSDKDLAWLERNW